MASKNSASLALFFAINILFATLTAATYCGYCDPKPKPVPSPRPRPVPSPSVPSYNPRPIIPPRTPPSYGYCPIDTLKLSVCADVLGGLLNIQLGQPSCKPCCSLIEGLVDLDAAVCLCTGLRANILGINLNIPVSLSLLLNACNRKLPYGFQCA